MPQVETNTPHIIFTYGVRSTTFIFLGDYLSPHQGGYIRNTHIMRGIDNNKEGHALEITYVGGKGTKFVFSNPVTEAILWASIHGINVVDDFLCLGFDPRVMCDLILLQKEHGIDLRGLMPPSINLGAATWKIKQVLEIFGVKS